MSEFVNYEKRDVTLPPGCKDLIDVLRPHKSSGLPGNIHANFIAAIKDVAVTPEEKVLGHLVLGHLSDFEKHVASVFDSSSLLFMLTINCQDDQFTLEVERADGRPAVASVFVQSGSAHEAAVRAFFARRGLPWPEDTSAPPQFFPGVPWQITYEITPCPPQAAVLSKLLVDLSREAFGLNDETPLCFRFSEITSNVSPLAGTSDIDAG